MPLCRVEADGMELDMSFSGFIHNTEIFKMNNSINYSGFVEMFIDSNEDFEPSGCADTLPSAVEGQRKRSSNPIQHQDGIHEDTWGD